MLNALTTFFNDVLPKGDRLLMSISGVLGAWATWAFGDVGIKIQYLFLFVIIDYVTGNMAAFRNGDWCSKTGFTGISRKVFIFMMIALCHSMDEIAGMGNIMRNAAIVAYSVNEFASIIENIEKLGFHAYIPGFIKRGLKQLREKEEELFNGKK